MNETNYIVWQSISRYSAVTFIKVGLKAMSLVVAEIEFLVSERFI